MDFFGPHLLAYFIATLHFLGTLAAIHAVLTVRTAQGSIAWALSLMFIPYLTLIPYLIFGRSTFDAYIQAQHALDRQCVEHREKPRLQRVGIDRKRYARSGTRIAIGQADRTQHLVFEHRHLPGESRQLFPRIGRQTRRTALQKDLAETLLE